MPPAADRLQATGPPRRPRRGAVTVEFALVAPVLFILVMGMIEIGRGFMVVHLMTNAAREGCRTGAIAGTTTDQIKTAAASALTAHGIQGATTSVLVNDAAAEAGTAADGDKVTVVISIPVSSFSWLPGTQYLSGSLTTRYSLRRE